MCHQFKPQGKGGRYWRGGDASLSLSNLIYVSSHFPSFLWSWQMWSYLDSSDLKLNYFYRKWGMETIIKNMMSKVQAAFRFSHRKVLNAKIDCKAGGMLETSVILPRAWQYHLMRPSLRKSRINCLYEHMTHGFVCWKWLQSPENSHIFGLWSCQNDP